MEFKKGHSVKLEEVEKIIRDYLPREEGHQRIVIEAMNYSVLAGGKRVRPMLMRETYNYFMNSSSRGDFKGNDKALEHFMSALEYIHTYSLVHDDLPAMDNDLLRRGMPTTHAKYGHAIGVLAGDGLLNYAYEVASNAFASDNYEMIIKALQVLSRKPGISGMLGGQVVDVVNSGNKVDIELLQYIHRLKTSALIQIAMMIGAILAGANDEEVNKIEECALYIGLAFQIQDDVLDVVSTDEELGKPVNSDEKNNKTTYVSIYGIDKAKELVNDYSRKAIDMLESIDGHNEFLVEYIESLINRRK